MLGSEEQHQHGQGPQHQRHPDVPEAAAHQVDGDRQHQQVGDQGRCAGPAPPRPDRPGDQPEPDRGRQREERGTSARVRSSGVATNTSATKNTAARQQPERLQRHEERAGAQRAHHGCHGGRPYPPLGSELMRALLVVNPVATSTSRRTREVLVSALERDLKLDVAHTTRRGHAAELARQARLDGLDLVVILGGDGTVNEVVNGLLDAGPHDGVPALGVVPGGGTNVFARALGLPAGPGRGDRRPAGRGPRGAQPRRRPRAGRVDDGSPSTQAWAGTPTSSPGSTASAGSAAGSGHRRPATTSGPPRSSSSGRPTAATRASPCSGPAPSPSSTCTWRSSPTRHRGRTGASAPCSPHPRPASTPAWTSTP